MKATKMRIENGWLLAAFTALLVGLSACAPSGSVDDVDAAGPATDDGDAASPATDDGDAASPTPEGRYDDPVYQGINGEVAFYDASGGAYTDALKDTIFGQFTDLTGVAVRDDYNERSTKFFAAAEAGSVPWDFMIFSSKADFVQARDKEYLAPISEWVPVEMLREGTYEEFGVQTDLYGIVLAYNTDKYPDPETAPQSMLDLYDTERFPGKRCMFQYHQFSAIFESALMADGVAKEDVYPLDLDRAFAKLDTIKDDIVWWSGGDESIQNIVLGECDLGVTWSGRAYSAIEVNDDPIAIVWKDGMYDSAYVTVPKDGPNTEAGQALLSFWVENYEAQADRAKIIPYTLPYNEDVPIEYANEIEPYLPAGENISTAIQQGNDYYLENGSEALDALTAWISE